MNFFFSPRSDQAGGGGNDGELQVADDGIIYANNQTITRSYVTIRGNRNTLEGSSLTVHGNHNRVVSNYCRVNGDNNTLEGTNATVSGSRNTVTGNYSHVLHGTHNNVTGDNVTVEGNYATVAGKYCTVTGDSGDITGDNCTVHGSHNHVTGDRATVRGNRNRIEGDNSKAEGDRNQIKGRFVSATGDHNRVEGDYAFAEGNRNRVRDNGRRLNLSRGAGHFERIMAVMQIQREEMMEQMRRDTEERDREFERLMNLRGINVEIIPRRRRAAQAFVEAFANHDSDNDDDDEEDRQQEGRQQRVAGELQIPTRTDLAHDVAINNDDTTTPCCVICRERAPICIALPCLHMSYCVKCSRHMCLSNERRDIPKRVGQVECAKCREPIEGIRRVFAEA